MSVVYAEPDRTFDVSLALPAGATVDDALERSRIRAARPDVEIRDERLGVFGRRASRGTLLRDGDRVEIYRPLRIDPREARRRRAKRSAGGEGARPASEGE